MVDKSFTQEQNGLNWEEKSSTFYNFCNNKRDINFNTKSYQKLVFNNFLLKYYQLKYYQLYRNCKRQKLFIFFS